MRYKTVVIGCSSGGLDVLKQLISSLDYDFKMSIVIVQHMSPSFENYLVNILDKVTKLKVKEVDEKENIEEGVIYISPPNYHILVEKDKTFSLSTEEKVCFSRPSIDILFETASEAYKKELIGIILTGANSDGSDGLKYIKSYGGLTIVQNPKNAEFDKMPLAAIEKIDIDFIMDIYEIADLLNKINGGKYGF